MKFSAGELGIKPVENNGKVLLFDGLNTYLRAFAATPTMDDDGKHIGGITGFLLSLGAAIRLFKPKRVVVIFDGKGGSQRRRAIFKDYKSSRRNMTKLNRVYDFATLEEEKEAIKWQLLLLVEILRYLPITILAPDDVEADDVIAYLVQTLELRNQKSIIISTDKDFLQLVNDSISVWNPIKKRMYTPERVVEDYGFHPSNFLLYRAVTGDKSDSIPGVEGIQQKTLLKYFPELVDSVPRDLDFMFESAQNRVNKVKKPPVALSTFLQSREILERNLTLMRLDDDMEMGGHTRAAVLDIFDNHSNVYDKLVLTKLLRLNKLIHALGNYEMWLQSTFLPLTKSS